MYCDSDDPNSWDKADQMADQAFELYESGNIPQALTQLREAIEINPNNSAWHFNAGLALDSMDRYDLAIKAYQRALELSADDPEILNCLAVDYTRTGQYDLAISTFERIEKIAPDFEPCYCNRIITYTEMEQHDKAEHMFYLAQQINPDCPICFYNIGNSLFSRGQYDRAIWCWERTAMLEPAHPQINYRIAQACWANGNNTRAREYFLAELRKNPGDVDVILDFGIFLFKCGDLQGAREKFNRILELEPGFGPAIFYLGELALKEGQTEKAAALYRRAMKRDDDLPGPRYRLTQIAMAEGMEGGTKRLLLDELKRNPDDLDVLLSIAVMFMQLNELDFAMDTLLGVVDEDPQNATAFYYMGLTLALQSDYEGALQFFEHAMTIDATNPALMADAAWLCLYEGRLQQAADVIQVARDLAPDDQDITRLWRRIQLALILHNSGHYLASLPFVVQLKLAAGRLRCSLIRRIRAWRRR
ncbi:MAG TPA: tetratricopeptide repeat protein [Anaerohalosphaeraceae bacterium]|jgi:tetratricopeptide (TPR) repeat protein|nr:tetratricopeptide repeat protein [Anaerohalosphaeraceae bacterium]HRT51851.1 tetratricopeptide repeat protein [Anaerohalosphaeraceae bacterium]HRT87869.1 tetratricopeptide repeat protein [Anaerohalosphaeraceae bacterium]